MKPSLNYAHLADLVADRIVSKLASGELAVNDNDGDEHLDISGVRQLLGTGRSKTHELLKKHNVQTLRVDGKVRVAKRHVREIVNKNTRPICDAGDVGR